jgi:hypothetical protein
MSRKNRNRPPYHLWDEYESEIDLESYAEEEEEEEEYGEEQEAWYQDYERITAIRPFEAQRRMNESLD